MKIEASRESTLVLFQKAKPFLGVIFLQAGLAGMDIISKAALNKGMSNYVFVVYRHVVATLVTAPSAFALDRLIFITCPSWSCSDSILLYYYEVFKHCRTIRPKMTLSIFAQVMLLSLLEWVKSISTNHELPISYATRRVLVNNDYRPVIDQNLYFLGLKYTTATFAAAMANVLPAITFVMACFCRSNNWIAKK